MNCLTLTKDIDLREFLTKFTFEEYPSLFNQGLSNKTQIKFKEINGKEYPTFINEFWTSKQRQVSSLHEIAYRACFKAQLPGFFIKLLTKKGEIVYDPFSGRGTTAIESALLDRNIVANDINPISKIISLARLQIPKIDKLTKRLSEIPIDENAKADIDLSMFYHSKTEAEIVSLRDYLKERKEKEKEDFLDLWIRMIATNRLTGHSPGFFSVYTLPPNQAVSPQSQIKINKKRNQIPTYRNTNTLILKKSISLIKDISPTKREQLKKISKKTLFLTTDARYTNEIEDESIQLTVTSPPFLDIVQYADDNWLRCWFNNINVEEVSKKITMAKTIKDWSHIMAAVFKELYRVTKKGGWVAFEVGEVRNGKIMLEEHIVPLGINAGFSCEAILINRQYFTKTSNIWGIKNNDKGTNSNRIVIFKK